MAVRSISRREDPLREPPEPSETASVPPDTGAQLGDEVEAFLGGRLVEHLVARRQPVPAWAVLNKVAHATTQELADLAGPDGDAGPDERAPPWRHARRDLAVEVLEATPARDELAQLQRTMLIPLELWMIDRSQRETISSRRVIEAASDLLDDLRADR